MSVLFFVEGLDIKLKNKLALKKWLKAAIRNESKIDDKVNIILCSDAYLLDINIKYLGHNYYTDVITFYYHSELSKKISGDLYISYDRIQENAKLFNTSVENELHRIMIHGVLHLLGYKDKLLTEKTLMTDKENFYLSQLVLPH